MTRSQNEKTNNKYHEWKKTHHYRPHHKQLKGDKEYYRKLYSRQVTNLHEMDRCSERNEQPEFSLKALQSLLNQACIY